jgi:hypothetical protein
VVLSFCDEKKSSKEITRTVTDRKGIDIQKIKNNFNSFYIFNLNKKREKNKTLLKFKQYYYVT